MNIAALVDVLIPIDEVAQTYEGLATPRRFVVIDGAGHNSFTDICLSVKGGTDLIGLAQRIGLGIPDNLAAGGRDGCEEGSIDTRVGWRSPSTSPSPRSVRRSASARAPAWAWA